MKLRKQTPAKAVIALAAAGLMFAFYGVIRADPRIKAAGTTATPAVNYERFFAPNASVPVPTAAAAAPHGRSRAS